jgi:hypothetical protein
MYRGCVVAAALLLCGCVETGDPYPANWAQPVRLESCAGVSGLYRSAGELGGEPGSALKLYLMLAPDPGTNEGNANNVRTSAAIDRVEIASEEPKMLVFRFRDATQVMATLRFSALECAPEGVGIGTYSGDSRGRANPMTGPEHETLTLGKTADGALLVKRREQTAGSLVPVSVSSSDWIRFPAFGSP